MSDLRQQPATREDVADLATAVSILALALRGALIEIDEPTERAKWHKTIREMSQQTSKLTSILTARLLGLDEPDE